MANLKSESDARGNVKFIDRGETDIDFHLPKPGFVGHDAVSGPCPKFSSLPRVACQLKDGLDIGRFAS